MKPLSYHSDGDNRPLDVWLIFGARQNSISYFGKQQVIPEFTLQLEDDTKKECTAALRYASIKLNDLLALSPAINTIN